MNNRFTDPMFLYPASDVKGDIIVEVGPGRGDFLFHLAKENPEKAIYGIEIKGKRFHRLITRRDKRELFNLKLVLADAKLALPELFKDNSVSSIFINFPDPWPKKRHAKNRLLKPDFLNECVRVLKKDGTLSITTDVERYAKDTFTHCKEIDLLKSNADQVKTESDEAYPTLFAEKWKDEGRTIYYQKHVKA